MVTRQKTTERRHKLRLELIEAAEKIVAADGLAALTARALANAAGCSLGAIYNVFDDLDDLVIAVNSRTLARLDKEIGLTVTGDSPPDEAEDCLLELARAYARFASSHASLWNALFERGADSTVPDWHMDEHVKLIRHIVKPLKHLFPERGDEQHWRMAGLMFSAVHGVVSLGQQGFFFAVKPAELEIQVSLLVRATLNGLRKEQW